MKGLRELEKVLKEELEVYKVLFELSDSKTQALLAGDLKNIQKITGSEQTLVLTIGRLEEKRFQILRGLEQPLGIKAEKMTLSEILNRLDRDNLNLSGLQQEITDLLTKLDETNSKNSMLIQKALSHINHTVGILTAAAGTGPTYGPNTAEEKDNRSSFIDRKV